jgi:ABC-type lipoprotein release transport system permease subunit
LNIIPRLAWRNLWRQPKRTWLTIAAMVFSNILLVFMMSLQFGMYGLMIENSLQALTGHMQVQAGGYLEDKKMRQVVPAIVALAERLRREPGEQQVAARARAYVLASSAERSYGIAVLGVEPDFEPRVSSIPGLIGKGRYLDEENAAEIVIGAVLARNLKVGLGDEITLLGSGVDGSFAATVVVVTGIFDSGIAELDRSLAQIPLLFFQDVFFMQGAGHEIVVNAADLDRVPALESKIEAILPRDEGLVLRDWNRLQPGLKQAIQADMTSSFFLYTILVVLVAFSVRNTQLMSVLERTREFGSVMSLGLKPGRRGKLVLLETCFMGLVGVLLGAALGAALTVVLGTTGFVIPGMEEMAQQFNLPSRMYPKISWLTLLAGPLVVFAFTLLASLYPATRMHWLQPVAAMRVAG